MKYEFKNLQGQPCCRSNHIKRLCVACLPQALAAHEAAGAAATRPAPAPVAAPAPTVAAAPEPPPVPSLADALRAKRGGAAVAVNDAPIYGGGPRRPTVAARPANEVIDAPPSLADAVSARRTR